MNISKENVDALNAVIRLTIDKADYEQKVEDVLKNYRKRVNMPGFRPYTFTLQGMESLYVTGIGVKRDPGIPLVAVGGALFLVSLLLIYLVPRNRTQPRPGKTDPILECAPGLPRDEVQDDIKGNAL